MKQLAAVIVCLSVVTVYGDVSAAVNARRFIPRFLDYTGSIVVKGLYDQAGSTSSKKSRDRSKLTLQEFVFLRGVGFVYHPALLTMDASVSLGLQQQQVESSGPGGSGSENSDSNGFSMKLKFLPKHPYNLEVWASRSMPLISSSTLETESRTIFEYGALARYLKMPWDATLTYMHYDIGPDSLSQSDSLLFNLHYANHERGIEGITTYQHAESLNNYGGDATSRDYYYLSFRKLWENYRFRSRWKHDMQQQHNEVDSVVDRSGLFQDRDRKEWHNELRAFLPYNLTSTLSNTLTSYDSLSVRSGNESDISSLTNSTRFTLRHSLYKSLKSYLHSGYLLNDTSSGDSQTRYARLGADYSKYIRWGSISTSLWTGASDYLSMGGADTLDEKYSLDSTTQTSFTLNSTLVEQGSIQISVVDHGNNDMIVPLVLNTHYQVWPVGQSFRIVIIGLPLEMVDPWNSYTFLANYSVVSAEYTLRDISMGGSLQVKLFDELIVPHFSYQQNSYEVLDGVYPGIPADYTFYTLGLSSAYGTLRGDVSRFWRRSSIENEDKLTAYVDYSTQLLSSLSASCRVSYEDRTLMEMEEEGSPDADKVLDENLYSVQAQLQSFWPAWNLNATVSGTYSLYEGYGESTIVSLLSRLRWHIGRFDLNVHLRYNDYENTQGENSSNQDNMTVRFVMTRELF
jgi:hypothetical protein